MLGVIRTWFGALSTLGRVGVICAAFIAGSAGHAAFNPHKSSITNTPQSNSSTSQNAACTATTSETNETQAISFTSSNVDDPDTLKGKTYVKVAGVDGQKSITYSVTDYVPAGCKPTVKSVKSEVVIKEPVNEVIAVGSYTAPTPSCDSNYTGACVPIASDVDCAGGSGNGPAYVAGPVYVVGVDIYGLDRDGDGVGCE